MPFTALGLHPTLAVAAASKGLLVPTPIQAGAIAPILQGRDFLGAAQTGSGKTAAYALPLLQICEQTIAQTRWHSGRRAPNTLIVVPTRELAAQVGEFVRSVATSWPTLAAHKPKIAVVFGGVSINPQMLGLRGGADVVVATPGRLLDLVAHNALQLASVRHLVLDEADRLLDLGFADELARVLALLPAQRQTLLFSATFPPAVEALVGQLLQNPVRVEVATSEATEPQITQRAIAVDPQKRTALLRHLVAQHPGQRMLVFVATQYAADTVAEKLYKNGIFASAFHGGLSQGARTQVLDEFKSERWDVVLTTDLAARGIDIAQLPIVVNYDLPRSAVDYTHRIGRTGRAGEAGTAISFVSPSTQAHFRLIEKRQGMTLPLEEIEGFEPTEMVAAPLDAQGGIKGKRPSKKDKLREAGLLPKPPGASD